jgi:hypothetical protein
MREKKIFFAGITRNLSERFLIFQSFIQEFLNAIPGAEVFLYENNSTDLTKSQLEMWAAADQRIHIRCEEYPTSFFLERGLARAGDNAPCRMEMIAFARNKLMEMLEATDIGENKDDLVIMFDPDIPVAFGADRLVNTVQTFPADIHAYFANGISQRGNYYDVSAYYDQYYPVGMELLPEKTIFDEKYKGVIRQIPPTLPPFPVFSAFGGIGIYRAHCIRGLRYSGTINQEAHTLFSRIVREYKGHPFLTLLEEKPTTHIQGALQGIYLYDKTLFYRNNSGYNYPVICEHVPFHAAMINRGYSKLFVCPSLYYISDHWE